MHVYDYNEINLSYLILSYYTFYIHRKSYQCLGNYYYMYYCLIEIWVYVFGRNQAKTLKVKVARKLNDQVKIFPKQSYAN